MVRVLRQIHVAGREEGLATAFRAGGARGEGKRGGGKKKRADVVGATELGPVRGFTGQDRVRPRPA